MTPPFARAGSGASNEPNAKPTGLTDTHDHIVDIVRHSNDNEEWMDVLDSLASEHHCGPFDFGAHHEMTFTYPENGQNENVEQNLSCDGNQTKVSWEDAKKRTEGIGRTGSSSDQQIVDLPPGPKSKPKQQTAKTGDNAHNLSHKDKNAAESKAKVGGPLVSCGATDLASTSSSPSLAPPSKPPAASDSSQSNADQSSEDLKNASRSERKRCREKQRRFDTNTQFAALGAILVEIETQDLVEETSLCWHPHSSDTLDVLSGVPAQGKILAGPASGNVTSAAAVPKISNPVDSGASSKIFKSSTGAFPKPGFSASPSSISSALSAVFNPSNRVDLIARTISILTQMRQIGKNRREELREARRQNTEMRKELEELRRLVAHYKAVGMGYAKPQEKVMMMVPMMVPQESVPSITAGFQGVPPCAGNLAMPWMPVATPANAGAPIRPPAQSTTSMPPTANAPGSAQTVPSLAAVPGAQLPSAIGVSPHQPFQPATHYISQMQGFVQSTSHSPMMPSAFSGHSMMIPQFLRAPQSTSPASDGAVAPSPNPFPPTQPTPGQAVAQAPSVPVPGAVSTQPAPFPHVPTSSHPAPPAAMYHHLPPGSSMPAVVGPHAHSHLQGPPSITTQPNHHQHPVNSSPPPPPPSGGPSPHQGGGGNLAHCA